MERILLAVVSACLQCPLVLCTIPASPPAAAPGTTGAVGGTASGVSTPPGPARLVTLSPSPSTLAAALMPGDLASTRSSSLLSLSGAAILSLAPSGAALPAAVHPAPPPPAAASVAATLAVPSSTPSLAQPGGGFVLTPADLAAFMPPPLTPVLDGGPLHVALSPSSVEAPCPPSACFLFAGSPLPADAASGAALPLANLALSSAAALPGGAKLPSAAALRAPSLNSPASPSGPTATVTGGGLLPVVRPVAVAACPLLADLAAYARAAPSRMSLSAHLAALTALPPSYADDSPAALGLPPSVVGPARDRAASARLVAQLDGVVGASGRRLPPLFCAAACARLGCHSDALLGASTACPPDFPITAMVALRTAGSGTTAATTAAASTHGSAVWASTAASARSPMASVPAAAPSPLQSPSGPGMPPPLAPAATLGLSPIPPTPVAALPRAPARMGTTPSIGSGGAATLYMPEAVALVVTMSGLLSALSAAALALPPPLLPAGSADAALLDAITAVRSWLPPLLVFPLAAPPAASVARAVSAATASAAAAAAAPSPSGSVGPSTTGSTGRASSAMMPMPLARTGSRHRGAPGTPLVGAAGGAAAGPLLAAAQLYDLPAEEARLARLVVRQWASLFMRTRVPAAAVATTTTAAIANATSAPASTLLAQTGSFDGDISRAMPLELAAATSDDSLPPTTSPSAAAAGRGDAPTTGQPTQLQPSSSAAAAYFAGAGGSLLLATVTAIPTPAAALPVDPLLAFLLHECLLHNRLLLHAGATLDALAAHLRGRAGGPCTVHALLAGPFRAALAAGRVPPSWAALSPAPAHALAIDTLATWASELCERVYLLRRYTQLALGQRALESPLCSAPVPPFSDAPSPSFPPAQHQQTPPPPAHAPARPSTAPSPPAPLPPSGNLSLAPSLSAASFAAAPVVSSGPPSPRPHTDTSLSMSADYYAVMPPSRVTSPAPGPTTTTAAASPAASPRSTGTSAALAAGIAVPAYWLGAFYRPAAFLSAVLRQAARSLRLPVDTLALSTVVQAPNTVLNYETPAFDFPPAGQGASGVPAAGPLMAALLGDSGPHRQPLPRLALPFSLLPGATCLRSQQSVPALTFLVWKSGKAAFFHIPHSSYHARSGQPLRGRAPDS